MMGFSNRIFWFGVAFDLVKTTVVRLSLFAAIVSPFYFYEKPMKGVVKVEMTYENGNTEVLEGDDLKEFAKSVW